MIDTLVEAPFNLGLKAPSPGVEPGVRFLPDALNALGFSKRLGVKQVIRIDAPAFRSAIDPESGICNAKEVEAYSKDVSMVLMAQVKMGNKLFVAGGDCSILIGIMAGLKKMGDFGLFFMDGHTDFVTVDQSVTKAAAGMDLAIAAGLGPNNLTDIDGLNPYVKEEHIYCFGNRELDADYERTILTSKVKYYPLDKIIQNGIENIISSFLALMHGNRLDGFWLHLDADVLNDDLMPCVDSRAPGGLSYQQLAITLKPLIRSPLFTGLSLTIVDPTMDINNLFIRDLADNLIKIFV